MEQQTDINFRKMNGLGNDFVILDGRARAVQLTPETISALCDRQTGIGCDQLIIMEPSGQADLFMRIYNADGGEVDACGNVSRCVGDILMNEAHADRCTIQTGAGILICTRNENGLISVDMGVPNFSFAGKPSNFP